MKLKKILAVTFLLSIYSICLTLCGIKELFLYGINTLNENIYQDSTIIKQMKVLGKDVSYLKRMQVNFLSSTLCNGYNQACTNGQLKDKIAQNITKVRDEKDLTQHFQVPNIVHYLWYNNKSLEFKFHHMLSVRSASKYIQPDVIYFHTNKQPFGKYWEMTMKIPHFKIVKRNPPTALFDEDVKPPYFVTSYSNIDRVKVLMEYGGIYLDLDMLIIRSFDDLRKHTITIGLESDNKSCGSVIVSSKYAIFLLLWINSYLDDYRVEEWAYNTGTVPFKLASRYPHLVHVERSKLNRPNTHELHLIYGNKTWNWKDNYAVHMWYRIWNKSKLKGVEPNMTNIKTLNNTFGQIVREILYNTSEILA